MATRLTEGPLCIELLELIEERIGPVKVIGLGESFIGSVIVDFFGKPRWDIQQTGEYYATNCPFCGDTKGRLWINHRYGSEDDVSSHHNYLAVCYNETACLSGDSDRTVANRLALRDRILGDLAERPRFAVKMGREQDDLREVGPPGELVRVDQLSGQHPAIRYLSSERGYDPTSLGQHWGVSLCTRADRHYRPAEGRFIIPIIMDDQWVGWQARYVGELNWKETGVQKYWNMPGFPRRRVLYNYDRAKQYRIVVLVEGVTSTWAVGDAAVGTLGTMSGFQRDMIIENWAHKGSLCVVMFDPDATDKIDKAYDLLVSPFTKGGGMVLPIYLPAGKDPGNYSHDANWDIIRNSADQYGVDIDRYL